MLTVDEAVEGFFGKDAEGSAVRAFREKWRRCEGAYNAEDRNWGYAKNILILAMEEQFSPRKGTPGARQLRNLRHF